MKRLFFLMLAVMSVFITSCGEDELPEPEKTEIDSSIMVASDDDEDPIIQD